jgi:hypothetical protein
MAEQNAAPASTPAPASSTPAQIPAGETAASMASVAAGQAKLKAMLAAPPKKGLAPTSPTARPADAPPPINAELKAAQDAEAKAKKDAEAQRVAQMTDDEKRFAKVDARRMEITKALTANDSKLTDAERTNLTSELRRLVAGQTSQAEREAMLENVTIDEWRARSGIEHKIPAHLEEAWDVDSEIEVLESFSYAGVTPENTRTVLDWYQQVFVAHGGEVSAVDWPAVEADFRALGRRVGLSQRLVDALIANEKSRLGTQ